MQADSSTAGTIMRGEFQKYGCKPSQATPVQADDEARRHAAVLQSSGSANRLLVRISSSDLIEVLTITYKSAM